MPQGPRNVRRFGTLLGALLALMVVLPFLPVTPYQLPLVSVLFSALLIASVYAVSQRPRIFLVGLALAAPALALEWLTNVSDPLPLRILDHASSVVFLSFVIGVLLTRILRQQDVTTDTIYGGICVYLLAGVAWAYAYDLIETVFPGSFAFGEGALPDDFSAASQAVRSHRFYFFSFVTLTTLGYGDITPLSQQARALAILEAVVGPLFLAIFIARLVGMHMVQAREERD